MKIHLQMLASFAPPRSLCPRRTLIQGISDVSAANLEPDYPHPPLDAFTPGDDTYWMSNTKQKDEFLGIKFATPVDVKKITAKVVDLAHSPPAFNVESSIDGDNWGRVVEVTIPKEWDESIQTYTWSPMDVQPNSVFAIRSQKDPSFCLGVREIPDPEEPDLITPTPIDYGTQVDVQRCSDTRIPQWWYVNPENGRIHNAAGDSYILNVGANGTTVLNDEDEDGSPDGAPTEGDDISIGRCTAGCAADTGNLFTYSDSIKGGFWRLAGAGWNNMVISMPTDGDGNIVEGQATIAKCGDDGATPADLANCPDLVHAQFDLLPMFNIEMNKKAVECSPYTHSHIDPTSCADQLSAQKLCAKDSKCIAYNWVNDEGEGAHTDKVWLCYELHDIHLKTPDDQLVGWELGIRTGMAEDPYEYEQTNTIEAEKRRWKKEEMEEEVAQA